MNCEDQTMDQDIHVQPNTVNGTLIWTMTRCSNGSPAECSSHA